MNIVRRIVVGLAGVIVVALAIELAAPKAVHAIVSTLVTVANTSSNPVPTVAVDTRSVNVVNAAVPVTGNVNATLTGTPTVSLNGNVPVANPLDNNNNPSPLVTQPSARNFFQLEGSCTNSGAVCFVGPLLTVTGSVAVVQSFSGFCFGLAAGSNITEAGLSTILDGSIISYAAPGPPVTSPVDVRISFAESTTTYFPPGSSINAEVFYTVPPIGGGCSVDVAGYLASQ